MGWNRRDLRNGIDTRVRKSELSYSVWIVSVWNCRVRERLRFAGSIAGNDVGNDFGRELRRDVIVFAGSS